MMKSLDSERLHQLKKRLDSLDSMYLEAQEENVRLREVELSVQHGLEVSFAKLRGQCFGAFGLTHEPGSFEQGGIPA